MKNIVLCVALITMFGACDNKAEREAEIESATQAAIDSVNAITERERLNDSMNQAASEPVISATPTTSGTEAPRTPSKTRKGGTAGKTEPVKTGGGTGTVTTVPTTTTEQDKTVVKTGESPTTTTEPEEKKKKGINNTVKGAIIGAGAGAVGGAIINKKNPGKGAIIGGVVGAGAGAVTGVILDKNKKKKEAAKDSAEKNKLAPADTTD